jgi:hypothetical protein
MTIGDEAINHQEAYSLDGARTNMAEEHSPACAAPKSESTITSLARIRSDTPNSPHGATTTAASRMASR